LGNRPDAIADLRQAGELYLQQGQADGYRNTIDQISQLKNL